MAVLWKSSKLTSKKDSHLPTVHLGAIALPLKIMRWLGGAGLILSLFSTPVVALSCAPWDGAQAYAAAARSSLNYSVVVGRLQFDKDLLPLTEVDEYDPAPRSTEIPAKLSGKVLETRHFSRRINVDVTLSVDCIASWCGQVQPGVRYLIFVEQASFGLLVRATPCSEYIFPDGSSVRRQVLDCHRADTCQAP